ncbi:MAG: tyrosinase family protein [Gammaproteobacteria bacterium]
MATRKSVRALSASEKADYIRGVKALKASGLYDQFVRIHVDAMNRATVSSSETNDPNFRNAAHRGPAFLPWHREFILRFELALQDALSDKNFGLPYWDWAQDQDDLNSGLFTSPRQLPVWANDFMGGDGDPVGSGPFTPDQWVTVPDDIRPAERTLRRNFGEGGLLLPTTIEVDTVLTSTAPYDTSPWRTTSTNSFRNQLEGFAAPDLHNRVHRWVAGSMLPAQSPNDPVFFLHHCNVDRLWARWQACSSNPNYLPVSGGPPGHNLNDPMFPWLAGPSDRATPTTGPRNGIRTPNSTLDHTALGYVYDTEINVSQTVVLRRTTGNRFVSLQEIQVVTPCNPLAGTETGSTIFVPGRVGGVIRAERGTLSDQVEIVSSNP